MLWIIIGVIVFLVIAIAVGVGVGVGVTRHKSSRYSLLCSGYLTQADYIRQFFGRVVLGFEPTPRDLQ